MVHTSLNALEHAVNASHSGSTSGMVRRMWRTSSLRRLRRFAFKLAYLSMAVHAHMATLHLLENWVAMLNRLPFGLGSMITHGGTTRVCSQIHVSTLAIHSLPVICQLVWRNTIRPAPTSRCSPYFSHPPPSGPSVLHMNFSIAIYMQKSA